MSIIAEAGSSPAVAIFAIVAALMLVAILTHKRYRIWVRRKEFELLIEPEERGPTRRVQNRTPPRST